MLEGVRSGPIIAGAYSSPDGTCPMLAAHRRGGRTSLATFARAWDGYTQSACARPVTERELRALRSMLEASLGEEEAPGTGELGRAVSEHREARERRVRHEEAQRAPERGDGADRRARRAPGEPDRSGELRHRPGWAWLRVFRRLDDFEAAVATAGDAEGAPVESPEPVAIGTGR